MLVSLSPIIADARGSAGALCFFQGRAGLVARIKTTPFQPLTPEQFLARASLASISQTWRTPAMDASRAGWIILAGTYRYYDVFHVLRTLHGSAMFAKLNRNLSTIGLSAIFEAPTTLSCGTPGVLTLTHVVGPPEHFWVSAPTPPAGDEAVVIRATRPLSPGLLTLSNSQSIVEALNPATAGPWDILTPYKAKHAHIVTGQQIFVLVNYVNTATGFAGQQSVDALIW